jgi:5'-phosphate synthase pdxT subunit
MDIKVVRNGYGGQLESFISNEYLPFCNTTMPLVFIRAPYILSVGPTVEILKLFQGKIIAAKEGNMLVTTFHPELTSSLGVHQFFLKMVIDGKKTFL